MALTKHIRIGLPSDGEDITVASTFKENLEGGSGPACTRRIFSNTLVANKTLRAYDIKKAVTYEAGDWTIFLDWNNGGLNGFDALVVVTNEAGATLRTIATFFTDKKTNGPNTDQTATIVGVAQQTLLPTERLCLIIRHGATAINSLDLGIDNFSASCDTRLVTPNEIATVLTQTQYDAAYFGDTVESAGLTHIGGYSNYLELQTNSRQKELIKKFLTRHNISLTAKVLELGAAVGFMRKVAIEEGYTNWTSVDWSNWCKRNEVSVIVEQDGFSYLQAQANNSFDYVISRALLECIDAKDLDTLITECNRVATSKQIHTTFLSANEKFYNIKMISGWQNKFMNDPNVIIEDYREDG